MDGHRFDEMARVLARETSRRSVLKGIVGGLAGVVGLRAAQTSAQTLCQSNSDCGQQQFCCRGVCYAYGITICHATGSASNPYREITINNQGLSGHCQDEDDIIPAPAGGCPDPCTPDSSETTCARVACGSVTNNCGETVECPSTCGVCETCSENNTCVAGGTSCGESCCDDSQQCCNGTCIDVQACCTDENCGNCEICDGSHTCIPGGASCGDACCEAGQQCCHDLCINADACCEDSDCGACETCGDGHICIASGAYCGEVCCDPETQQCCNGGCIEANACCINDDCPGNQTCNNGQCVAQCIADGGACVNKDDCCDGSACACGICRSGQITICHATGNVSNPYDEITINVTDLGDHCGDTSDLVPAPEGGCPPAICTPESKAQTCGGEMCGTKTNNCGQSVACGACGRDETCQNGVCVANVAPTTSIGGSATTGGTRPRTPTTSTTSTTPTTPTIRTEVTALPETGIGQDAGTARHGWMGPLAVIGGGAAFLASWLHKGAEQPE